jgi:Tfp pilus assembly protein PilV
MCADSRRRGSALIDVLIAMTILATTAMALLAVLGQTSRTMRGARETEREVMDAAAELERIAVLSGPELAQLRGRSTAHGWRVDVVGVAPDLFDISIAASETTRVLLRTTLYRPSDADATP